MTMRAITADVVPWPARSLRALQVRVRHQPSNGASAWHRGAPGAALARRRGDRIRFARCPLWVDIVAKRFLVPERGIIFQERVRMENIDSRIPSFGFCYCLLQRVDGSLADFCNTIGQRRSYSDHKRTHALQNERRHANKKTASRRLVVCSK